MILRALLSQLFATGFGDLPCVMQRRQHAVLNCRRNFTRSIYYRFHSNRIRLTFKIPSQARFDMMSLHNRHLFKPIGSKNPADMLSKLNTCLKQQKIALSHLLRSLVKIEARAI